MKKLIINWCMNTIKNNKQVSEEELEIIEYGLVGLYLTISKMFVILLVALLLGILFEVITFFLIYGVLRTLSFGLHATKSWICLISSLGMFILIPYLALNTNLNIYLKLIVGIIGIILMFKNSPADTCKRPIVDKKRRWKLKISSTMVCSLYLILSLIIFNNFYSNCFVYSVVLQNILISPVTYKLFKLPYNNYISYLKDNSKLNNL